MKRSDGLRQMLFIISLIFCFSFNIQAQQKPVLDTDLLQKWPNLGPGSLTNDGKFYTYCIWGWNGKNNRIYLSAVHGGWDLELIGAVDASSADFTSDSKKAVFMHQGDSLGIVTLGTTEIKYIRHVNSYRLFDRSGSTYAAYQLKDTEVALRIRNMETGEEKVFSHVLEYQLSQDANVLILKTQKKATMRYKRCIG
jgi:hypothetical protein